MADGLAWQGAMQGHQRGPGCQTMPQGELRAAADEDPMARARLAVVPPERPMGVLAIAGEAVSLGVGTGEAAYQAAARPV
jgi:hypothetical protein